jgi:hypothetical protein
MTVKYSYLVGEILSGEVAQQDEGCMQRIELQLP